MAEVLFYAGIPLVVAALFVVTVWVVQYVYSGKRVRWQQNISMFPLPLVVSLLCMVVGVGATVYYANVARADVYDEANSRFLHQVELVDADLQSQIADLSQVLHGVRGLFLTQRRITRLEFHNFVSTNDLHRGYLGARGLGFVEHIQRPGLPAFLESQQRAGWSGFQVKTSGDAPDLFIIKALEPAERNQGALGFDLGSETVRRTAAEESMRSGNPILSQRISLIQDVLKRPAFLFMLPVYEGIEVPVEQETRLRTLRGWAYAPLVFSELMSSGQMTGERMANFQLFDGPELNADTLIYDSEFPTGDVQSSESLTRPAQSAFSVVRPVLLVNKVFYLRANSTAVFEGSYHPNGPLRGAALGSGLSVMAAMVLWLLMVGRARALHLAQNMTQDLDRLAAVAKRTSNAVFFTDTEWRITWVNEGFTRLSGYAPEEAMGRLPSSLLHSPLGEAPVKQSIDAEGGTARRIETQVLQRNKSGVDYWVDLEVVPLRSGNGAVTGYLVVQSDVSEEVRIKAALLREKERAENILTGTNVGTWESNLLTGEQQWNDRWSAMMGFSRDEVESGADQFWQQRVHPVDLERLNRSLSDCIAGVSDGYSCDVRVQRKDGSWMWILSRAKVMSRTRDGQAEWIGGIHTDITDIKQVELSLRDMEAFLDRAGRIAGVGAWQMDLRTREITFSPQTCAIHGMAPGFQPTEEAALSFYPATERERLRQAMERAAQHGDSWDLVLEFNTAQGEQRWVRNFGEIASDESGPTRLVGAFQDVTKDHLAQLEVERSGELLRGAIEALNEAFVLYDPQDRLVFCNDKYRDVYALTADLLKPGATFESLIRAGVERGQYADAVGREEAWIAERLAAHNVSNMSIEQRLSDGRWLKVLERRMPDGHMVGFRVDITELKQATAVAESISARRGEEQRRMQSILEGTHVGTWEWNLETGECIFNAQYVAMLGYTLQDMEPAAFEFWAQHAHPDDLIACDRKMQEHLRGECESYDIEARMKHKAGHWIWVLSKGKLTTRSSSGAPQWIYGTHMDITERKMAEQQLAQTSVMLQNVLDSATTVGVMTQGLDAVLQVFNKGAENLLGYSAAEVIGLRSASLFFDAAEMAALRETLELLWGREPSQEEVFAHTVGQREAQEWTLMRKDGSRFKASLIFSPMHDAGGAPVGHLAVVYDISKQKEYELSLREAMRLAEQSSVAKSQFLANMSHEIRTPMNAILGMLQLLRNTQLDGSQRDYAEKAAGAARSLLGLLNDILDFSKVEAGKMQLNPEPFLLEELLGDLSVILSSNLGGKNVDLLFDVDPALPKELVGDAMRLKQILINLGGNAVKFTEKGQVVVRWTLLEKMPGGLRLGVAVIDSGIGIAPENQARIFNAFTQAEANTTRRFGGTGLGLVISTRLIRLMGGELQLSSVLGQGSTFSFTLELAAADRAGRSAEADATATAVIPVVHALLVDDNPAGLATGSAMMRSLGWEVEEAPSGEQALALLKDRMQTGQAPLDAVFVDWQMPEMDGWETLRNVRRLYGHSTAPKLVLLSRRSRDALAERTDREQELLDGLLVKPLTAPMFLQALKQAGPAAITAHSAIVASHKPLLGMRVLLVEDNAINQQVAQELLQGQGASVQLADNGALGVAAVRNATTPFDVVLMDLQMPVMDGLTATRTIRVEGRFATLPIVAMTANVMGSDREACLDAGMNDHVGKPFDLNELVQTLIRHTRWAGAGGRSATGVVDAKVDPSLPAPAPIDVVLALKRMGGNKSLLWRSIAAYIGDAQLLPARLQQALQSVEWSALQSELHSFKGLSATVGANILSQLAAHAERLIKGRAQASEVQTSLDELTSAIDRYLPALESAAAELNEGSQGTAVTAVSDRKPDAAFMAHLKALLIALQASDMVSMELHATLRQEAGDSLAEALQPLDQAMADLEFEVAAIECEKLVRQFAPATIEITV